MPVPDTQSVIAIDTKIFSEGMTQQGDGLGMQLRLGGRVEIDATAETPSRSGSDSM